jgi:hypothetical protein
MMYRLKISQECPERVMAGFLYRENHVLKGQGAFDQEQSLAT